MRYFPSKLLFCLLLVFIGQFSSAQTLPKNSLSVKFVTVDHLTPLENQTAKIFDDYTFAGDISYHRWLGNHFNLTIPLKLGWAALPQDSSSLGSENFFASLDLTGQWHPLKHQSSVSPYLLAGIGGFYDINDGISAEVPLGLGINFRVKPKLQIQLQSEYRYDFSDFRNNFMHSLGLMFYLGKTKKTVPEELPPPDRDGDGVLDSADDCPEIAGLAAFSGCPDTDGDGIADPNDDCPTQIGTLENRGCPLADLDGDGVPDNVDDCPQQAGPAASNGCPDTDQDGVIDPMDRCPTVAGPISNNGCPEIKEEDIETLNFVAQNVQFQTGKATLKEVSFEILDKVITILRQYPGHSLAIGGHTDSIGDSATNQLLSERRAKSCYDYLIIKGIDADRMDYVGYGETRPIGDNRYKDGRELNRRVEFNLYLK